MFSALPQPTLFPSGKRKRFSTAINGRQLARRSPFSNRTALPQRPTTVSLYNAMIGIAERRTSKSDLAHVFRDLFA